MKRLFGLLLFAAVVVAVVAAAEIEGEAEEARARVAFSSYEARFGKHYSTDEERARRFELYKVFFLKKRNRLLSSSAHSPGVSSETCGDVARASRAVP